MIFASDMFLKGNDEIVGAVGVRGGTGEQDRTGIEAAVGGVKTSGMRHALMNEQSRRLAQNFALAGGGN
jgi:hypothetical protein